MNRKVIKEGDLFRIEKGGKLVESKLVLLNDSILLSSKLVQSTNEIKVCNNEKQTEKILNEMEAEDITKEGEQAIEEVGEYINEEVGYVYEEKLDLSFLLVHASHFTPNKQQNRSEEASGEVDKKQVNSFQLISPSSTLTFYVGEERECFHWISLLNQTIDQFRFLSQTQTTQTPLVLSLKEALFHAEKYLPSPSPSSLSSFIHHSPLPQFPLSLTNQRDDINEEGINDDGSQSMNDCRSQSMNDCGSQSMNDRTGKNDIFEESLVLIGDEEEMEGLREESVLIRLKGENHTSFGMRRLKLKDVQRKQAQGLGEEEKGEKGEEREKGGEREEEEEEREEEEAEAYLLLTPFTFFVWSSPNISCFALEKALQLSLKLSSLTRISTKQIKQNNSFISKLIGGKQMVEKKKKSTLFLSEKEEEDKFLGVWKVEGVKVVKVMEREDCKKLGLDSMSKWSRECAMVIRTSEQVFVWIGRDCKSENKTVALYLSEKLFSTMPSSPSLPLLSISFSGNLDFLFQQVFQSQQQAAQHIHPEEEMKENSMKDTMKEEDTMKKENTMKEVTLKEEDTMKEVTIEEHDTEVIVRAAKSLLSSVGFVSTWKIDLFGQKLTCFLK